MTTPVVRRISRKTQRCHDELAELFGDLLFQFHPTGEGDGKHRLYRSLQNHPSEVIEGNLNNGFTVPPRVHLVFREDKLLRITAKKELVVLTVRELAKQNAHP